MRGISKYQFCILYLFQIIRYFLLIKCRILLNAGGSIRSFSLLPKRSEVPASEARSCYWTKPAAQYEFHSTMVGKKQTTCKSRRKEKGVPKIRAKCPACTWTTRLTTRENAWGEMWQHQHQFHHFAPVRQVEDSEDRVAEDTSNQEVITTVLDLAQDHPTERACHIDCQVECDAEPCPEVRARYPLWSRWEYCTHKCSCTDCQCERWVHYDGIHAAPVRQVEDSEKVAI